MMRKTQQYIQYTSNFIIMILILC